MHRYDCLCEPAPGGGIRDPACDSLATEAKELTGDLLSLTGTLMMAVDRLGGIVEGAQTHQGNFLQRVDELRAIERKVRQSE